jgi:hypothetical protein
MLAVVLQTRNVDIRARIGLDNQTHRVIFIQQVVLNGAHETEVFGRFEIVQQQAAMDSVRRAVQARLARRLADQHVGHLGWLPLPMVLEVQALRIARSALASTHQPVVIWRRLTQLVVEDPCRVVQDLVVAVAA